MAGIGNPLEESANFYRLVSVVVDRGSDVLRDVLLHQMKPSTLEAVLQANIRVINNLLRTKVLFTEQYVLLTKAHPNAEEFNISLLLIIFRNICTNVPAPILGWGVKEPDANDFSLAADLLRLRSIRNQMYAHRSSTKVTNVDFETLWLELSDIIERVSRHGSGKHHDIRQTVRLLKQQTLDPENDRERMLEIFQNWRKQDEDFRTMILQRFNKQVYLQKVRSKQWVRTDAIRTEILPSKPKRDVTKITNKC